MSDTVSNEKLLETISTNRSLIIGEIKDLRAEVKSYTEKHNILSTQTALLEAEVKRNSLDIDKNWVVTRKLDSKITRWSGIIACLMCIGGALLGFLK